MQFQVPQFIEVEDKIFGPLTFKQFIYLAGGAGAAYLLYRMLPGFIALPLIIGIGALVVALAFVEWNGRPLITGVESAFYYFTRSRLYLWSNARRAEAHPVKQALATSGAGEVYAPRLSQNRLHELAWSLDINERIKAGAEEESRSQDVLKEIRTARDARIA
jgi:hypothetical protein